MKKIKAISLLIVAAILILSISACTPKPFAIEEAILCKSLDSDYAPIDPVEIFPSGTTVIYLSVKAANMTTEDKITVRWNYLETNNEINVTEFATEEAGSGYIGFNLEFGEGFPSGKYNAIIYMNTELYKTVEFSVE